MRIIAKSTLIKFCTRLPKARRAAAEMAMAEWYTTTSDAEWNNFAEIKATFNSADYIANGKIVFDVGGNKYRIVGLIGFRTKRVFVLFVGTHAEYDAIDVTKL
ncbi:type II toxin-antitoxin system HigB family toxin [Rhizobium sp.]|uniref:type II toxin-antitoxin system HigB family toxin n=1 Tax=Rhizobium sp. TaxID=391 RepID=UPI002F08C346